MSRYKSLFETLKQKRQCAFVPFVMLGDPDLETSYEIICTLIQAGADALELGFPFSDPIADGPTIQKSAIRALNNGTTPADCFLLIRRIREKHFDIPIGLLLYSNLVLRNGIETFYRNAAEAGVDSILLADVPVRESEPFRNAAIMCNIDHILIAPPNATDQKLCDIAKLSSGYVYILGRAGVTGTETKANSPLTHSLRLLKEHKSAPAIVGFGISQPSQISEYLKSGVDGAIAGSSVVRLIEEHLHDKTELNISLSNYCIKMKSATQY